MTFLLNDTIIFYKKKEEEKEKYLEQSLVEIEISIVYSWQNVSHIEVALKNYSLWEFGRGRIRGRISDNSGNKARHFQGTLSLRHPCAK